MIEGAAVWDVVEQEMLTYPIMLFLQVKLYERYIQNNLEILPSMFRISDPAFTGKRNELLRRLLRSYRPEIDHTLKRLSVARHFDKDLFKYLVQHFDTGLPADEWRAISALTFLVRDEGTQRCYMHGVIREGLTALLDEQDRLLTHHAVGEYYRSAMRAPDDNVPDTPRTASYLAEAFHHFKEFNPAEALDWWHQVCSALTGSNVEQLAEPICREAVQVARELCTDKSEPYAIQIEMLAQSP